MKQLVACVLCLALLCVLPATAAAGSYEARCAIAKENGSWIVDFGGTGHGTGNGNVRRHQIMLSGAFDETGLIGIWSDLYHRVVADIIPGTGAIRVDVTQPLERLRVYAPLTADELSRLKNDEAAFALEDLPVLTEGGAVGDSFTLSEPGYYFIEGRLPGGDLDRAILVRVKASDAAQSRYQSTAVLTDAYMADLNYDGFFVTVTNPTENRDSGTVALVLASHMITIHFIDYDLAPHESRVYEVNVVGHMGHIAPTVTMIGTGLSSYLNADMITFSSDEDLQAYRAAIPYEQNAGYYVTQGGSIGRDRVVVCDGRPGDDWLARYTGIRRHDAPTADASVSHEICKP